MHGNPNIKTYNTIYTRNVISFNYIIVNTLHKVITNNNNNNTGQKPLDYRGNNIECKVTSETAAHHTRNCAAYDKCCHNVAHMFRHKAKTLMQGSKQTGKYLSEMTDSIH